MRHLILVALALLVAAPCSAQERGSHDAGEAALRGFTRADLARIEPLLAQGVFGMVEHAQGDILPGIHLATEVEAPASVMADVLAHPDRYPTFMPALSAVTLRESEGGVTGFTWQWRTSVFTLGGEAMLTVFAPRSPNSPRGYRIILERTDGDLGHGREVWRIIPRGPGRCLVMLSSRMDLTDSNYVTRQMANASRSLSRSINLAMGFAMLLRARGEAERRVGFVRPELSDELSRPVVNLAALEPLMQRGDLLLVSAAGTQLRQAAVMTRYDRELAQVRDIMMNPVAFAQALIQGSSASIRESRDEEGVTFDWRVDLPIIGTGGSMLLSEPDPQTVVLSAREGAMQGGLWRFETGRLPSGATSVMGWAQFDVADVNFLLRAVVDADGGFRAGLSAATEIMMARALRIRLTREPATAGHGPLP